LKEGVWEPHSGDWVGLMGFCEVTWQVVNDARLAGMPPCGREREQAEFALCQLRSLFGDTTLAKHIA
jgi:hypothetical protein